MKKKHEERSQWAKSDRGIAMKYASEFLRVGPRGIQAVDEGWSAQLSEHVVDKIEMLVKCRDTLPPFKDFSISVSDKKILRTFAKRKAPLRRKPPRGNVPTMFSDAEMGASE